MSFSAWNGELRGAVRVNEIRVGEWALATLDRCAIEPQPSIRSKGERVAMRRYYVVMRPSAVRREYWFGRCRSVGRWEWPGGNIVDRLTGVLMMRRRTPSGWIMLSVPPGRPSLAHPVTPSVRCPPAPSLMFLDKSSPSEPVDKQCCMLDVAVAVYGVACRTSRSGPARPCQREGSRGRHLVVLTLAAPVSCSVGRPASWQSSNVTAADSPRPVACHQSPLDSRHPVTPSERPPLQH